MRRHRRFSLALPLSVVAGRQARSIAALDCAGIGQSRDDGGVELGEVHGRKVEALQLRDGKARAVGTFARAPALADLYAALLIDDAGQFAVEAALAGAVFEAGDAIAEDTEAGGAPGADGVAQAGAFLHGELAFFLVAGRHRHNDVDHHGNDQRPGVEGNHQVFTGIEDGRTGRQCRTVDRDGDAIGRETTAETATQQQGLHALIEELAVLGIHQHVVDQFRTRTEQALIGHAGASRVRTAAVLQQAVATAVAFALENLHFAGVQVNAGLASGFHQRHRTGEVGIVGVTGVEAVRTQAIDVGRAVRGGGCGPRGHRAGIGVLGDLAQPATDIQLLAGAAGRRAAVAGQRCALVDRSARGAGQGALIGPAGTGHGAAFDGLGCRAVDAGVGGGYGAAPARIEHGTVVDPDIGLVLHHGRLDKR
jgi:hypothetical protein